MRPQSREDTEHPMSHPIRVLTAATGEKREVPICGAPCRFGGLSPARKYSRVDLGVMWHCNRIVKEPGQRCWQHSDRTD